jgi:hypothetical protein
MNGYDHIIERQERSTVPTWKVLNHAGMVRALTYSERDAALIKAALDGTVACPECPHCIANMANWSKPA